MKVLCDIYGYEVPKEKYKKILKDNMIFYKLIYRQDEVYQEYCIRHHEKSDDMSAQAFDYETLEQIYKELPFHEDFPLPEDELSGIVERI